MDVPDAGSIDAGTWGYHSAGSEDTHRLQTAFVEFDGCPRVLCRNPRVCFKSLLMAGHREEPECRSRFQRAKNMNIADLFEKTIKSIVSLAHAFFYSLLLIARNPAKGSIRLWWRWRRDNSRSMGPQTFQFLSAVAVASVVLRQNFASDLEGAIVRYVVLGAKDPEITLMRLILLAMTVYILIDIVTYVVAQLEMDDARRRQKVRGTAVLRYLVSGLFLFSAVPSLIWGWLRLLLPDRNGSKTIDFLWNNQWLLQMVLYGAIAVSIAVWTKRRSLPSSRQSPRPKFRRKISLIVVSIPAVTIFYISIDAPRAYLLRRPDIYLGDALADVLRPDGLSISYLRCDLEGSGATTVSAILTNGSGAPFAVDLRTLGVIFAQGSMAGYVDQTLLEIGDRNYAVLQPANVGSQPMLLVTGQSSVPVAFRYARPAKFDELVGLYTQWKADSHQHDALYSYFYQPSCFLSFAAVDVARKRVYRWPDTRGDKEFWYDLSSSGAGEVKYAGK